MGGSFTETTPVHLLTERPSLELGLWPPSLVGARCKISRRGAAGLAGTQRVESCESPPPGPVTSCPMGRGAPLLLLGGGGHLCVCSASLCLPACPPPGRHSLSSSVCEGQWGCAREGEGSKEGAAVYSHHAAVGICLANSLALICKCRALYIFQAIKFYQRICAYNAPLKAPPGRLGGSVG